MSSTSTTDPNASATSAPSSTPTGGGGGGSGPTNSPLLFFVALGFGVVFTNLWIIVGVKYCFRYNQRNRQLRAMAENGEPIDLANMHGPRRRRREKKLMTMEEVNERFPLTKYKLWRSKREAEGLPAEGGVTTSPSRAASIRSKRSIVGDAGQVRTSRDSVRPSAAGASDAKAGADAATPDPPRKSETVVSEKANPEVPPAPPAVVDAQADDDDEDDPIRTAVAPEMLATPGDACAICLDTLEDDDDVRGLTCGHAFHASCVDPWLTSRRACCPLCKADYYIPKPRPEGSEDPTITGARRSFPTAANPAATASAAQSPIWIGSRTPLSLRSLPFLSRGTPTFVGSGADQTSTTTRGRFGFGRSVNQPTQDLPTTTTTTTPRSRLLTMPTIRMPRLGRAPPPVATTAEHGVPEEVATPGELEAGRANDIVVR